MLKSKYFVNDTTLQVVHILHTLLVKYNKQRLFSCTMYTITNNIITIIIDFLEQNAMLKKVLWIHVS